MTKLQKKIFDDSFVRIVEKKVPNNGQDCFVFKVGSFNEDIIVQKMVLNKEFIEYIRSLDPNKDVIDEIFDLVKIVCESIGDQDYFSFGWTNDTFVYIIKNELETISGTHIILKHYCEELEKIQNYATYTTYGLGALVAVVFVGIGALVYSKTKN